MTIFKHLHVSTRGCHLQEIYLHKKTEQHTTPGINRLHCYDYNIKML